MLLGRIDEIKDGTVFGWAANGEDHSDEVTIYIVHKGQAVANGKATQFRPDLRANRIGDGHHAFEIALPPEATDGESMRFLARSASGQKAELFLPDADERHIERLFDRFVGDYTEALRTLRRDQLQLAEVAKEKEGLSREVAESLASMNLRVAALEKRVEESEVFFVRIDGLLKGLVAESKRPLKPPFWAGWFARRH